MQCGRCRRSFRSVVGGHSVPRRFCHDAPTPGFLLDIDGVLLGKPQTLEKGKRAMAYLQGENPHGRRYPFVLMTNGGGIVSSRRAEKLTQQLGLSSALTKMNLVQSHSPFIEILRGLRGRRAYIVGGKGDKGKEIASQLGFTDCQTFSDMIRWYPPVFPFVEPDSTAERVDDRPDVPFGLVLVLHDSRHWGPDIQIMIDILSSRQGRLLDPKDPSDASEWTPDQQVPLWFSNGDVLFANAFPRSRLGQGAFKAAFEATFRAATGHQVYGSTIGKPTKISYDFALKRLREHTDYLGRGPLDRVVMIGDNPESDIAGANGAGLDSVLVRTGVYRGGRPTHEPTVILDDVLAGIEWAVDRAGHPK